MSWLRGKTVVITGGTSGIGKGVAFAVSEAGANVVLAGRAPARVDQAVSQLTDAGRPALGLPTDVGDVDAVERLMDEAIRRFGSVDGLVTAAGLGHVGPLLDQPLADVEETVRTDFLGTIHCITAAAKRMGPGSHVVTVASAMAGAPSEPMPVYAAIKTAVVVLTDGIRGELARRGIRISCLLPGGVATHFQDGWGPEELATFGMSGTAAGVAAERGGPDLSRVMRARDIAPAVVFAFELPDRAKGATLKII